MTVPLTPTQIKQAKRAAKEAALAEKQLALPDRRYGVIVADPPWRFEPYSRETGMDRAADNHYPTSGVAEIAALPVPTIAADDCVLFLWATVPCLEYALVVLKAWGFVYRSQYVWVKDRIGLGFWSRNKHEILLIGTRGHIPAPAPGTQWPSVIEAPVGAHSVKPEAALQMIEHYYLSLRKIELHRRGPARLGWDAWGDEAEGNMI
jgi:N6-adenosine-specific RNA methylase IME4